MAYISWLKYGPLKSLTQEGEGTSIFCGGFTLAFQIQRKKKLWRALQSLQET
jgi:hypothetical protein